MSVDQNLCEEIPVDPFLLMLVVMLLLFLVMNYYGKRKTAQVANERLKAIQVGNTVRTHSGFFGTIVDIDGETVTLESPSGAETTWHKNAIFGAQALPLAVVDADDAVETIPGASAPEAAPAADPGLDENRPGRRDL